MKTAVAFLFLMLAAAAGAGWVTPPSGGVSPSDLDGYLPLSGGTVDRLAVGAPAGPDIGDPALYVAGNVWVSSPTDVTARGWINAYIGDGAVDNDWGITRDRIWARDDWDSELNWETATLSFHAGLIGLYGDPATRTITIVSNVAVPGIVSAGAVHADTLLLAGSTELSESIIAGFDTALNLEEASFMRDGTGIQIDQDDDRLRVAGRLDLGDGAKISWNDEPSAWMLRGRYPGPATTLFEDQEYRFEWTTGGVEFEGLTIGGENMPPAFELTNEGDAFVRRNLTVGGRLFVDDEEWTFKDGFAVGDSPYVIPASSAARKRVFVLDDGPTEAAPSIVLTNGVPVAEHELQIIYDMPVSGEFRFGAALIHGFPNVGWGDVTYRWKPEIGRWVRVACSRLDDDWPLFLVPPAP